MEFIRNLSQLRNHHRHCVATVGNFDGVHLGHQFVLNQLLAKGKALQLPAFVITFEPQPYEFFAAKTSPARLPQVTTVGAVDRNDELANFSNFNDLVGV